MFVRTTQVAALLGVLLAGTAAAEEPLFPFVISYDAPHNVTNVSAWLEQPAGKHGFVRVRDGQFVVGKQGGKAKPLHFWATNFCFEACFPAHEQAERVAARLARLGINCVRMHHMDNHSIWGDSPNKLTIDPKKIERLDYLIYQLKLHGVYTNLNLHVSRWFDEPEGFVARQQRPNYDKGLDNFEPRMIELQKKYARDLLTHVNPYTKTAYSDEPAVAFVEINNENALFAEWGWGHLDNLPEPYAATFRKLWNDWLRKKYGGTDGLRRAWNVGEFPLGDELLKAGDFSKPLPGPWHLETDDQTKAEWSVQPAGPEGRRCLRIVVTRQGQVAWRPQLTQSGFALKKATAYTLSFSIRTDKKQQISVNCMMAHDPWQRLGLDAGISASPEWKQDRRTFIADRDDPNARITFTGLKPGTYELADVSLRPGGIVGLAKDQRLEDDSVPVLRHGELGLTEAARGDFIDFLWETERDYWRGIYRFLKDELKVKPLVSGTQLGYSPVHVQAGLDYIDAHSYWHHPSFPGRPWDPANWTVNNGALVNTPGGTLAGLAARRVAGMAYTVSEYNHPEPNQYAAEGFPLIAAFGAFQKWDGIFNFCYSHSTDFEPRKITGFFDIKSVTPRIAHMPACAAMFLRGDVAPARKIMFARMSPQAERKKLHETLSAWRLTTGEFGLDQQASLTHAVAIDAGKTEPLPVPDMPPVHTGGPIRTGGPGVFYSDTGELRWDASQKAAGFFTADTPRTKLFTGFVAGRTFDLGNVKLKIAQTRLDWATVSMVCIDGPGFDKPGRILIAATGVAENTGAKLRQLDGGNVTLGNQWGSEPELCEGVPAEITLPVDAKRVRFYALDESGNRRQAVSTAVQDGRTVLTLDPRHKTVWYEVEVGARE
jgi:hypothetical protein